MHAIVKLKGLQRVYILLISRTYNDNSSDVLMVLVGVPPIHLMVQCEYQRALREIFWRKCFRLGELPIDVFAPVREWCSHAFV